LPTGKDAQSTDLLFGELTLKNEAVHVMPFIGYIETYKNLFFQSSLQMVHLGLSWIEVEASTVEIAGGFEVFTVPVAADSSLN
jgi:hypothetical protein